MAEDEPAVEGKWGAPVAGPPVAGQPVVGNVTWEQRAAANRARRATEVPIAGKTAEQIERLDKNVNNLTVALGLACMVGAVALILHGVFGLATFL